MGCLQLPIRLHQNHPPLHLASHCQASQNLTARLNVCLTADLACCASDSQPMSRKELRGAVKQGWPDPQKSLGHSHTRESHLDPGFKVLGFVIILPLPARNFLMVFPSHSAIPAPSSPSPNDSQGGDLRSLRVVPHVQRPRRPYPAGS